MKNISVYIDDRGLFQISISENTTLENIKETLLSGLKQFNIDIGKYNIIFQITNDKRIPEYVLNSKKYKDSLLYSEISKKSIIVLQSMKPINMDVNVLTEIGKNLDYDTLQNFCLSSKKWSKVCDKSNNKLWIHLIQRDFPEYKFYEVPRDFDTWRSLYRMLRYTLNPIQSDKLQLGSKIDLLTKRRFRVGGLQTFLEKNVGVVVKIKRNKKGRIVEFDYKVFPNYYGEYRFNKIKTMIWHGSVKDGKFINKQEYESDKRKNKRANVKRLIVQGININKDPFRIPYFYNDGMYIPYIEQVLNYFPDMDWTRAVHGEGSIISKGKLLNFSVVDIEEKNKILLIDDILTYDPVDKIYELEKLQSINTYNNFNRFEFLNPDVMLKG